MNLKKVRQWNESAGGIFYPEELEFYEKNVWKEKCPLADGHMSLVQMEADDDGNPIRETAEVLVCGENLIVNVGRGALASMHRATAAGLTVVGVFDLGLLAVGSGSSGGTVTPLPADTGLSTEETDPVGGPVVSGVPRPAMIVTTPPPGPPFLTNLWTAQIGTAQLNGVTIDEAGIFCLDDGTLFARRTFTGQTKAAGFVMEFRWSILY
jgi:hypothetical protein